MMQMQDLSSKRQVLSFKIGSQLFGVPVEVVQDVFFTPQLTEIPLVSKNFKGILNLQGRTVVAVNLRYYLGFPPEDDQKNMSFLVESGSEHYCFIVDKVEEVIQIDTDKCDLASSSYSQDWQGISSAVYKMPNALMVILDPHMILSKID